MHVRRVDSLVPRSSTQKSIPRALRARSAVSTSPPRRNHTSRMKRRFNVSTSPPRRNHTSRMKRRFNVSTSPPRRNHTSCTLKIDHVSWRRFQPSSSSVKRRLRRDQGLAIQARRCWPARCRTHGRRSGSPTAIKARSSGCFWCVLRAPAMPSMVLRTVGSLGNCRRRFEDYAKQCTHNASSRTTPRCSSKIEAQGISEVHVRVLVQQLRTV